MTEKSAIYIVGPVGEVSDGYHTFNELYDHRLLLYCCVLKCKRDIAWRSKTHSDGKGIDGWFIAGLDLPTGQVTYHLPERLWGTLTDIKTLDMAPKWDGHTPQNVLERLADWLVVL